MRKIYFIFHFTCSYFAHFVQIGPQIKKFPKNWVAPLKVSVSSVLHRIKLTLILNKNIIIDFSKKGIYSWVLCKKLH